MRELKFRAWDNKTCKMSDAFDLFGEFTLLGAVHAWQADEAILAGLKWDRSDNQDSLSRLNDLVIMQDTGIKDKNGKEIYEGDLLKFFDKVIAVVVFQDLGGWSYKWIDETYVRVRQRNPEPFFHNITLWEVAGNIYQDKHLLE